MVTRIGGQRRKTRSKMSKPKREQGKISLRAYFQEFTPGQRIALKADPSVRTGIYFRRFHGMIGVVSKRLGSCYEIVVNDGKKEKHLIVHPVHMKALA